MIGGANVVLSVDDVATGAADVVVVVADALGATVLEGYDNERVLSWCDRRTLSCTVRAVLMTS